MKGRFFKRRRALLFCFTVLLCICALLLVLNLNGASVNAKTDESGYIVLDEEKYFNIDYKDSDKRIIGLSIEGYNLLGVYKAYIPQSIKRDFCIKVPSDITYFSGLSHASTLKKIELNEGLKTLYGLSNTGLTELNIPSSVTLMAQNAFSGSLKKITVAAGNSVYESRNNNCIIEKADKTLFKAIEAIDLNSSALADITKIGPDAFYNSGITEFTVPARITDIADNAFGGNPLETISVEEDNAVYTSQNSVTLQQCNCVIKKDDNSLTVGSAQSEMPNYITSIKPGAFTGNPLVKSLTVPASVTQISYGALSAAGLEHVKMQSDNAVFYNGTDCIIEKSEKGDKLIAGCANTVIPTQENVTEISMKSFQNNRLIKHFDIPQNIKSIGSYAFANTSLESVKYLGEDLNAGFEIYMDAAIYCNPDYWYNGGFYVENSLTAISNAWRQAFEVKDGTVTVQCVAWYSVPITSLKIPDSVQRIYANAFVGAPNLEYVEIGSGIKYIGNNAFTNSRNIKSVRIAEGAKGLVGGMFWHCENLIQIYVPSTLESPGHLTMGNKAMLIASDYAAYQNLYPVLYSADKPRLFYEIDVDFNVAGTVVTHKKLAGKKLSFEKLNDNWIDVGKFSLGALDLSGVESWTRDSEDGAAFNVENTAIPKDMAKLTLFAKLAEGFDLTLDIPYLSDMTYVYGKSSEFNAEMFGFVAGAMTLNFTDYKTGGKEYNSDITPVQTGEYVLKFLPAEGFAWKGGAADPFCKFSIVKAVPDVTVTVVSGKIYAGGDMPQINAVSNVSGKAAWAQHTLKEGDNDCVWVFTPEDYRNYTSVSGVYKLFAEKAEPEVVLSGLTVTDMPHKTEYSAFEAFDKTGLTITADYSDGTHRTVTDYYITYADGSQWFTAGDTAVTVTYMQGNTVKTVDIEGLTVKKARPNIQVAADKNKILAGNILSAVKLSVTGVEGKVVWTDSTQKINVGVGAYGWTFTPADIANYQILNGEITVIGEETDIAELAITLAGGSLGENIFPETPLEDIKKMISVTAIYSDGALITVPDEEYEIFGNLKVGICVLTVLYEGKTQTIEVTVKSTEEVPSVNVLVRWMEDCFDYDGTVHKPLAYYEWDGIKVILETEFEEGFDGIEAGSHKVRAVAPDNGKFLLTGETVKTYIIKKRELNIIWSSDKNWVYSGDAALPNVSVQSDFVTDSLIIQMQLQAKSGSALSDGKAVNAGGYIAKLKIEGADNYNVIGATDFEFLILRKKLAKPVVNVLEFDDIMGAINYIPYGYDAQTMTLSGEERGGNYVLKVALKDFSNYEWEDGGNGELSFVLSVKNQPEPPVSGLSAGAVAAICSVTGAAAVVAAVALIVALKRKQTVQDNDGFNDPYYGD